MSIGGEECATKTDYVANIIGVIIDLLMMSSAAQQPEAAGSPGHFREQVRVDPHLCSEDEQPAGVGPE